MNQTRKNIEQLKNKFSLMLEHDAYRFRSAIVREIDFLFRQFKAQYPDSDLNKFSDEILKKFRIPNANKLDIKLQLNAVQSKVSAAWINEFDLRISDWKNYEKILASYQVDFNQLDKDVRDSINTEVKKAAIGDFNYQVLRQNLINKNVGVAQAGTLANTALLQFDNASMFEYALQAGVTHFKYDGVLHPSSRDFCILHFHKIYTYEQILKLDNKQGLPVVTSCGGWRCVHYWSPIFNKKLL